MPLSAAQGQAERHPLDRLGPFCTAAEASVLAGISPAELSVRTLLLDYLGCPVADSDELVYPVWQFTHNGQPLAGLADILQALAAGSGDRWTWALWLAAPAEHLDGMTTIRWLAEGHEPDPAIRDAARDAERWQH